MYTYEVMSTQHACHDKGVQCAWPEADANLPLPDAWLELECLPGSSWTSSSDLRPPREHILW